MPSRIAIIGAGLGGLVMARVLHIHDVEAVVYEREPSRTARGQGGMLDLHVDTGQRALHLAGLDQEFRAIARAEGQDLRLLEPDGTLLLQQDTPDDAPLDRPEVDRADLRALLLDSIPARNIHWGVAFTGAAALPGGGYRLEFADGSSIECDVLAGADGANSRVRPLLTGARPAHLGVNTVELGIPDAEANHPALSDMVGRGNYWVLGDRQSLAAQRNGDGRIRVYLTFDTPQDWLNSCGIPFGQPAQARAALSALFEEWAPQVRALIEACDDTVIPRPLATLPVGLSWPSRPDVTLLGDAAHLMPPVGFGANAAMLDGAELALALVAHPGDPAAAVSEYERAMFERTAPVAQQAAEMNAILRSSRSARAMLKFFQPQPD